MTADVSAFLGCGDIKRSSATLQCFRCGMRRNIPLSCKRRSFCEPCAVREQQARTSFLRHRVFGTLPVRLWTFTLPFPFRIDIGLHPKLLTAILEKILKVIFRYIKLIIRRIQRLSKFKHIYPASVTVIHRVSRNLAPNIHFHCLVLDGAFVRGADNGPLTFVDLPKPSDDDIDGISQAICREIRDLLWRENLWDDLPADGGDGIAGYFVRRDGSATRCRFMGVAANRTDRVPHGVGAFNLSASEAVRQGDRKNLRRLIAYLLSPHIADDQLLPDDDGVTIRLRRPRAD
jgi:hypothetical protein